MNILKSANMDAKQVMSERCNGNSSCSWNPEEIQLSDPCPNVFKYMTVNYKCGMKFS